MTLSKGKQSMIDSWSFLTTQEFNVKYSWPIFFKLQSVFIVEIKS